jgi:hypothetical protein
MFGVMIWEITHGRIPYDGTDIKPFDIASRVVNGTLRPKIEHAMCSDPLLLHLMAQCFHHNPKLRPSMLIIYDSLRQRHAELKASDVDAEQPQSPLPPQCIYAPKNDANNDDDDDNEMKQDD